MFRIEALSNNPAENIALEEMLMTLGHDVFMLWRNSPSVIIGRFGSIADEVNEEYCCTHGLPIVRRNSGGGAVYHDLGNVNYSFITTDSRELTLEYFAGIMIDVLGKVGVTVRLDFRHNDILADGAKISGMAQYRHQGVLLHHGCLLFDADLAIIPKVLKRSGKVANIRPFLRERMTVADFMAAIAGAVHNLPSITV